MELEQKIKILFISHEFTINGSTRSLVSLIDGIRENHPDVICEVLLPKRYGHQRKAYKEFKKRGIVVRELWYRRDHKKINEKYNLKLFIYDILNFLVIYEIKKLYQKGSYDVICSNSTAVDLGCIAIDLGKPHIQFVREAMEEGLGCEYRNKKKIKRLLEESKGIIFVSGYLQQRYLSLYNIKNYIRIFNGFKIEDFLVRNHRILEGDQLKIVQIGALTDAKGCKSSLKIMRILKHKGMCSFHFSFLGEGDAKYVSEMKELIEDYELHENTSLSGYTHNIKQHLKNADILFMNSNAEGFGRATVEGMLAGCLVVGKGYGGTKELVENGVTGVLFENEEEASDLLSIIMKNREEYVRIARRGQLFASESFSNQQVAEEFIDYISGFIK